MKSMSDLPPHIRNACHEDAVEIAGLMQQLGYESTPEQVGRRLSALQGSSTDLVLVATSAEHLVGCVSLHVMPMFHADGFVGRITSMVVDAGCQGIGIGKVLMGAAEEWFMANGCVKVEVTSGDQREGAHRFYEAVGFTRDGQRLSKALPKAVVAAPSEIAVAIEG
ncbi:MULTISPECIES: GNAT family N-acetyltransferase [unclassified Herbaspirillum]|uniref:GNAT family N-acetyltransferase n=1 Tax=unclassified Herbaspirillum TaxID=2624150 RepID=UPI001E36DD42|nr:MULTISPECIES: GNAT family N-acetyltransferase [unclassified Herbaspirillum]